MAKVLCVPCVCYDTLSGTWNGKENRGQPIARPTHLSDIVRAVPSRVIGFKSPGGEIKAVYDKLSKYAIVLFARIGGLCETNWPKEREDNL